MSIVYLELRPKIGGFDVGPPTTERHEGVAVHKHELYSAVGRRGRDRRINVSQYWAVGHLLRDLHRLLTTQTANSLVVPSI